MRMIHLAGASSVSDPAHGEATAGRDGVFELEQPFADHLLKTAAGTWRTEADHVSQLARESLDALRDPSVALRVLSDLRERVANLEAVVFPGDAAVADAKAPEFAVPTDVPTAVPTAVPEDEPEDEPEDAAPKGKAPDAPHKDAAKPTDANDTAEADKPPAKTTTRKGPDKPPATRPA
jgi:hypothetical protein